MLFSMKKITIVSCFLSLLNLLVSCEETIILDLDQAKAGVVIDGLVTNVAGTSYVKISKTAGFYESGPTEKITSAIVRLVDDKGVQTVFTHNPEGSKEYEGVYLPNPNFKGGVGRIFKLTVTIGSQVYEAQDELLTITKIDSVGYRINATQEEDPAKEGEIYEALLYTREPQETKDYYLFKFYRNDSLTYFKNGEVYFANDEGIGEAIDGFQSPVYYSLKDTATVEMYSLTRNGFLFYNDLNNLNNGDGGMFSPPPANPRTNWSNGALGFFQVSATTRESVIIVE